MAHIILVYRDKPLMHVLQKMEAAGQMLKWVVELNIFEITFDARKAIKGQALVDSIVELTRLTMEPIFDLT